MPSNDTRIVQMEFDNKDFERDIAVSQKSLEKFKEELDFEDATKQMEDFSKSADSLTFDTLADNIQKLTDKFTGLGNIGEFVMSKIRSSIESTINSAIAFGNSMTTMQVQAGKGKYEMLNKSVQTIKNATDESEADVYKYMERLNDYTDQTSYDFAAMADNIGKFTSVGVGLDVAERSMEGIANWAAKSGGGINEANRAMYNISQMMGVGHMQLIDWKSIQNANMATKEFKETVMETAVETGDLIKENGKYYTNSSKYGKKAEVTYKNFQETLSKGWFTSDVMTKTLEKYADTTTKFGKTAFEAAQKCTNFTDVLNAWKDMLSTGWMQSYQIVFGKLGDAMNLFSGICDKVSGALEGLMKTRNNLLQAWSFHGGKDSLWGMLVGEMELPDGTILYKGAYGLLDIIQDIGNMISEGFWNMIKMFVPEDLKKYWGFKNPFDEDGIGFNEAFLGHALSEATKKVQQFVQSIKNFFSAIPEGQTETRAQQIQNMINGIFSVFVIGYLAVKGIAGFVKEIVADLQPSIDLIIGLFGDMGKEVTDGTEELTKSQSIQKFFKNLSDTLTPITSSINKLVASITNLFKTIIGGDKAVENAGNTAKSLGQIILDVFSIISNVVGPIISLVSDIIDIVNNLFKEGLSKEGLEKAGKDLETAFNTFFSSLFSFSPELKKSIDDFFALIFGTTKNDAENQEHNLLTTLRNFFGGIFKPIFDTITGVAEKFKNGDVNLFTILKEDLGIGFIGKLISGFASAVKDWNLYKIIMMFLGGTLLFKAIGLVTHAKESVKGIRGFFQGLESSLKNGFQVKIGDKLESTGEKMQRFAVALGIMAASVAILGSMPISSLIQGVIAVGAIMALFWGFTKIMDKQLQKMDYKAVTKMSVVLLTMAGTMSVLSVSIGLMMLALTPLAKDPGAMVAAVLGFAGILVAFSIFMKYVKKNDLSAEKLKGLAGTAAGLSLLMLSLKFVSSMNIGQILKGLIAIGGIMLELLVFMNIMKTMDISSAKVAGLAGFAIGLGVLVISLKMLGHMDIGSILKGLLGLGAVMVELLIFMNIMKRMELSSAKVTGLAGLAIGIGILVLSLKGLANMSIAELAKGLGGLSVIMLELLVFMNVMKEMNISSVKIAGLAGFIFGIIGLVISLKILGSMNIGQMGVAILGLTVVMFELLVFMNALKNLDIKTAKIADLLTFVLSIIGMAAAMKMLGSLSIGQMATAILGLVAIVATIIGLTAILKKFKLDSAKITGLLGVAAVIVLFSFALNEVKNIDFGTILAFSVGLAAAMIGISVALKTLQGMSLGGAVKAILILGVAMAAILGVLALMMPVIMGSVGSSMETMASRMSGVADMIAQFSGKMGGTSESDIDKAKRIFDKLYSMVASFGGLSSYKKDVDSFGQMLLSLGSNLGIFQKATSALPDPESSSAIKTIDAFIARQGYIASFTIGNAGANILALGVALGLFNDATSAITSAEPVSLSLLKDVLGCADLITAFSSAPVDSFKGQLAGLGGALKLYADGASEVTGLEAGDIPDVSGAVMILNAISDSINQNGGFTIPDIPDQGSLGSFGSDLAALAIAVEEFANACTNVGEQTTYALADLDFLAKIKTKLTEDNIKATKAFDGTGVSADTLGTFAIDIGALGTALSSFANNTDSIDTTNAIASLGFLADLKERLTKDRLKATRVFTDSGVDYDSLSEFADDIGQLGYALNSFATNVAFDADSTASFDHAIESLDFLVKLQSRMPAVGGVVQFWEGHTKDFSDLGDDLRLLGSGLNDFATAANTDTFNYDKVMGALEVVSLVVDLANNLGQMTEKNSDLIYDPTYYLARITEFIDSFMSIEEAVGEQRTFTPLKTLIDMMKQLDQEMSAAGFEDTTNSKIFVNYMKGISSLTQMSIDGEFKPVGENIALGVKEGIKTGQSEVVQAAIDMVNAAKLAAEEAGKIKSPSRVFEVIGNYMALGLAKGMNGGEGVVGASSEQMTEEAIGTAGRLMAQISQYMSENIDANPVITPVLDLSNVEQGIAYLNGYFGGGATLNTSGARGYATRFAPVAAGRDQNGSDLKGVRSDISQIGTKLDTMSNRIANLKIYIDKKVLAGGVTDGVDANIGRKSFYSGRRN